MNVVIDLKHVASGPYFRASGKFKPDKYLFERVPGAGHIHRLVIPGDKAAETLDDLALRLQTIDIPVQISFQIEDSDLDNEAALTAKSDRIKSLEAEIQQVREQLRITEAQVKSPTGKTVTHKGPSAEELEMLVERDELIELLTPFGEGEETPVQCLARLLPAPPEAGETIIERGHGKGETLEGGLVHRESTLSTVSERAIAEPQLPAAPEPATAAPPAPAEGVTSPQEEQQKPAAKKAAKKATKRRK